MKDKKYVTIITSLFTISCTNGLNFNLKSIFRQIDERLFIISLNEKDLKLMELKDLSLMELRSYMYFPELMFFLSKLFV